jgi:lipoprotein NlpD
MTDLSWCRHAVWATCLAVLLLGGCASTRNHAPVEERGATAKPPSKPAPSAVVKAPSAAPAATVGAAEDSRPVTYVVKPGDTLMRIALEAGQSWRDVAKWSGIDNPNLIEPGMVLRLMPPAPVESVASTKPVATARVDAKPLDAKPASAPASAVAVAASGAASVAVSVPARDSDDDIQWAWPATGPVLNGFDDARTKGLGIGGKAGDPVYAAADGRVVYAGSGLRGYGNLVIVKHNATYLTAYAHNQTLLVKEDQTVRKGQKIAEMGSSDAERVQLHFEIRKQGKPIDPAKLLPSR